MRSLPLERKPLLDAGAISLVGALVSAVPALWYPIVWPDGNAGAGFGSWLFLFAFSFVPFALAAALRATGTMGRLTAVIATAAAAGIVVFGQYAGLDPNDPSSTAAIALVIVPFWAAAAVFAVWVVGVLARAAVDALRRAARP
jgi:hypothetical protein